MAARTKVSTRRILSCLVLLVGASLVGACSKDANDLAEDNAVPDKNNRIDYVEFAAADIGAFKAFYAAAFGWTFEDWGPDYASFSGAGLDGGVRGAEEARPGSTLVILYADDLDAAKRASSRQAVKSLSVTNFRAGAVFTSAIR